jgi:hypothetical protein
LNKSELIFEILKNENEYPEYPFEGEPLLFRLLKDFLEIAKERLRSTEYDKMIRTLLSEGIHIEGTGIESLAGDLSRPAEEENFLFQRLKDFGFNDVIRFLQQSHRNYIQGNYEASNAMTRTALEEIVKLIALDISQVQGESISPSNPRATRPQPIDFRRYLKETGFLDGNEFNLLEAFYQFSSSAGSHGGLSDESDCRLRRFMMIGICLQYLEKFSNFR